MVIVVLLLVLCSAKCVVELHNANVWGNSFPKHKAKPEPALCMSASVAVAKSVAIYVFLLTQVSLSRNNLRLSNNLRFFCSHRSLSVGIISVCR